jgi:hypothetical protein
MWSTLEQGPQQQRQIGLYGDKSRMVSTGGWGNATFPDRRTVVRVPMPPHAATAWRQERRDLTRAGFHSGEHAP